MTVTGFVVALAISGSLTMTPSAYGQNGHKSEVAVPLQTMVSVAQSAAPNNASIVVGRLFELRMKDLGCGETSVNPIDMFETKKSDYRFQVESAKCKLVKHSSGACGAGKNMRGLGEEGLEDYVACIDATSTAKQAPPVR